MSVAVLVGLEVELGVAVAVRVIVGVAVYVSSEGVIVNVMEAVAVREAVAE